MYITPPKAKTKRNFAYYERENSTFDGFNPRGGKLGEIEKVPAALTAYGANISCPQNQHARSEISMKMARGNESALAEKLTPPSKLVDTLISDGSLAHALNV